jgi:predicted amidohydrolase YtcJ
MGPLVFSGGQVFDGVRHRGRLAVAVRDGRVVAVGRHADDVRPHAGEDAELVDLGGGLLLPGFHDAHLHPMVCGLERARCELYELATPEEYLGALAGSVAAQSPRTWVRGGGWSADAFGPAGPTAEMLDRVVADRPAFVMSSDHHNAWVNTAALRLAGVDRDTPDPPDGWIVRDAHGRPSGTLREAAIALVGDHVSTSREENREALAEAQQYLHRWGITGWHDALIGGYAGLDDPTQAYLDLIESDRLEAHVNASLWWDRHRGVEQLDQLIDDRHRLEAAGLRAASVKIMMDGIAETFTATIGTPYGDQVHCPCARGSDHGLAFLDRVQAIEAVTALDAAGFQVHFHAIGDLAVHDALDSVEAARRANGMNDLRHQVAHLQLVRPEDRPRFADLGVTANLQGMWVQSDSASVQLLLPHLDAERCTWHYPFADIAAAGANLAGGSDWPVNPPEPIGAVHALVNRTPYRSGSEGDVVPPPLVAAQALSLQAALAAYTSGSAHVNHRVDVGRIRVGARADLAILDRDPFAGPPEEIGAAQVIATYVGGTRVFDRSSG